MGKGNMKTYLSCGMIKEIPYILAEDGAFGIQEMEGKLLTDRYIYPGDSIKYELDNALVGLYDIFRDFLFGDTDEYYRELKFLPLWTQHAGQDSDFSFSAEDFRECIAKSDLPNLYRHLYLVDCQFLVGTVQNLLCAMEDAFINYYKTISSFRLEKYYIDVTNPNDIIVMLSEEATKGSAYIETYFTKAYSILDIMCKICYEIQYQRTNFNSYLKIKSADVLWGKRKKLKINEVENTIYENCEFIRNIEAIRNEIVHNGTWELSPKIFIKFKDGMEEERFMLFPDMEQGHLATVKNRKHFFSSNIKVNDILPKIHKEFKMRILETISQIKQIYVMDE